jgi:hypothetical protein
LDYVFIQNQELPTSLISYQDLDPKISKHIYKKIQEIKILPINQNQEYIIQTLQDIFEKKQEFGLLNRLDNDT